MNPNSPEGFKEKTRLEKEKISKMLTTQDRIQVVPITRTEKGRLNNPLHTEPNIKIFGKR